MPANDSGITANPNLQQKQQPIASYRHMAGFLLITIGVVVFGLLAQHAPAGTGNSAGQLGPHSQAIPIYLTAILLDWGLLYYCWAGVHHHGGTLTTLSGGRWTSWKSLSIDVCIVLPFWALWEGTAYAAARMMGPSNAKSIDSLLPQSAIEVLIWIATSITAGICEEMIFRGYVQKQCQALAGNLAAAVLAQAVLFGLFHFYQSWKNVIVITILGVLYGALAGWRKNVRTGAIVHAWSDIWEGWLKFVVWN